MLCESSVALEVPVLTATINDFAAMMPQASAHELEERLERFKTETGHTVAVLTVKGLENENIDSFGRRAFARLPLNEQELEKSVLLLVARKEQKVGLQVGSALRPLFPEPAASQKLQTQVELYFNGMRPDLGIHGGVHHIFKVISGDFRIDRATEEEKFEEASQRGAGAGAILGLFLAPFLAFMIGGLWGIYATHYGVQRGTRLFMGAVLGGGTAKIVMTVMAFISSQGDALWYFIMALSIPLAAFASLTEYWMSGNDWMGIPREKDGSLKRKPSDKMGI
jgi:uncharacterized membrane protein YgcG